MALAEVFEALAGPDAPVEFRAYDGSQAGAAGSAVKIARKLGLREGMRLLDVGCGWGGMVMHAAREYGVKALGVTLSAQQAAWAQAAIGVRLAADGT